MRWVCFSDIDKVIYNKKGVSIASNKNDHGVEFQNEDFKKNCNYHGIQHTFFTPWTPCKNGVVERKNISLVELARMMLNEAILLKYFMADVVSTACYVMNRVLIKSILKGVPYELYKRRKLNLLHVFGWKCFILDNGKYNLGIFNAKANEGIFIWYSTSSKVFRVFNKRT